MSNTFCQGENNFLGGASPPVVTGLAVAEFFCANWMLSSEMLKCHVHTFQISSFNSINSATLTALFSFSF